MCLTCHCCAASCANSEAVRDDFDCFCRLAIKLASTCGSCIISSALTLSVLCLRPSAMHAGADAAEALWQCAGFPPSTGHSDFLPAVDTLLAAGVKADVRFSVAPSIDQNPLHAAAASDHASVAHALLAAGAAVDATDNDGRTALHHAAMYGSSTVAGVLLQAGAAVDVYGSDGFLPLHLAVALKKTAIAELLCQHMSAQQINLLSLQGNHSALFTAVVTQNADVVSALLGAGADPVAPSTSSGADLAAFRAAACMPSVEVVNCFLQHAAADQLTAAVIVNAASLAACHIRSATQPDKQQQVMIRLLQAAVDKDPDVLAANVQSAVAPTFAAAMITCLLSLLKQAEASMCAREAAVSANLADVAAQRTAVQQLLVGVAAAQKWPAGGTGAAGGSRWSGCRWQLGALQAAALFALGAGCCAALQCLRARSK